jgi:hypothetical protein
MIQAYVRRLSGGWKSEEVRQVLRQEKPNRTEAEVEAELRKLREIGDFTRLITERRQQGLGITTGAAVPMDQKYATLAAIHEKWRSGRRFPLDFWLPGSGGLRDTIEDDATDADWDGWVEMMPFLALKEDADPLTEQQVAGLETMLAEVAADLAEPARHSLDFCSVHSFGTSTKLSINVDNVENMVMGDQFKDVTGPTIVSRSKVERSFNHRATESSWKAMLIGFVKRLALRLWAMVKTRFGWS